MHLPSAGMIRFRFDGFAFASQPCDGHPEVSGNIGEGAAGARGVAGGVEDADWSVLRSRSVNPLV